MAGLRVRHSLSIAGRLVAAALTLLLLLALVVHTPPVRRAVLRRTVAAAADRLNVRLDAGSLHYDLLSLSATLTDVRLTAIGADTPFLIADSILVTVPPAALLGPFALGQVRLDNARVAIARTADGTTNLPSARGGDGPTAALPIQRLHVAPLAFSYTDLTNGVSVSLPHLDVDLGSADGSLRLVETGMVRLGDTGATIESLRSGVAFDGRVLRLDDLLLESSEGDVRAEGTLAALVDEPHMSVSLSGTGDLARLMRWTDTDSAVEGIVSFDATATGPLASPSARATLQSARVAWNQFTITDLSADVAADAERLFVSRLTARTAGGTINGSLTRQHGTGRTEAAARWLDLDIAQLQRLLSPDSPIRPSARTRGSLQVAGTGESLTGWSIEVRTQLDAATARAGEVPVDGTIDLDVVNGAWRLVADTAVASAPVTAGLNGSLQTSRLADSTISGSIKLDRSDLPLLLDDLRAAGLTDVAAGTVTRGRVAAAVDVAGTIERPRLKVSASAQDVASGEVSGIDATLSADGTPLRLAVDVLVAHAGSANTARAIGTVWPGDRRLDSRVTAELRDLPALLANPAVRGSVRLDVTASGPFDALQATGTGVADDAAYSGYELGDLTARIELTTESIGADVNAPELNGHASARVTRTVPRHATLALDLTDADLARLLRRPESPLDISGRVSGTARASGPLDDWRRGEAEVLLSRFDAYAGELPVTLRSAARVSYGGSLLSVANLEANVGGTYLSIAGGLPASTASRVSDAETLRAVLTGDAAEVLAAVRATGLTAVEDISVRGPVALLARISGSLERPLVAADLDISQGEAAYRDLPAIGDVELRAQVADGAIELLSATARWQDARISAAGRLPLRLLDAYLPEPLVRALPGGGGGAATLAARADGITPAILSPFLDASSLAQLEGVVDASLQLEAAALDAASVTGEARLDRLDVRIAGLPVTQREPTRVAIGDGIARVTAWDWTGQGATLTVQGDVRLIERRAALLAAGRIDLRTLAPFVSGTGIALGGTLAPRVSVIGALDDPRVDGEVALTGGEIRLREPRIIASDVTAFAVMTPTGGSATNISGTVNGGRLSGSAAFEYGRALPWNARITSVITGMGLEFPEGLRSELNADLALALRETPAGPGGGLTGTVTITRSAYREPLAVVTGLLANLRTARLTASAADSDGLAERVDLNVRVVTDSDVIVDNNLAQLELGGDLRVIGTAAAPSLSGRAELRQGGQLFLGQNVYTLESGSVDFTNPVTIEPNLDIDATTRAGGYDIELSLTGTPDTLAVELAAPGTSLGQADLASLLLTGRLLEDVPGAEAQIVGEQVIGYLSGDVLGLAGRAIGLDTIRLGGPASTVRRDPAAVAAEADPTSRLTFGKTFSDAVEITFSQSLRNSASTWIVDYEPFRQVGLRLVSRDDNLRTYEFRHDLSIGGPPRPQRDGGGPRARLEVGAVSFAGDGPLPAPELQRIAGLRSGDRFDVAEWLRARDRVEAAMRERGYLETRVTATRQERTDTVDLSFAVDAGPPTAVVVNGFTLADGTRAAIEDAWTQSVFDDFLREEAAAIVRDTLTAGGFLQPQVTVALTTNGTKTMTIDVTPGTRARTRRIVFTGDDAGIAQDLERWAVDRRLEEAAWRDPDAYASALTQELRTRGHLNARVTVAPPRLEGSAALLAVDVESGPRYTFGDIRIPADVSVPAQTLRDAVAIDRGMPYDAAAVEAARERLARAYRREGFSSVRVEVRPVPDETTRTVTLPFEVVAGRRDVLRRIDVRGARSVDEDVITRALDLDLDEPLGADAWLQARSRVFDTSLFRRVDVTVDPLEDAAGAPVGGERPMRVVVTVEEWPALRLRYGFQLSEERPEAAIDGRELAPGLSADLTRRTLFGRPITVGAAAEYQPRERLGRIFANAPTLAGLPIESLLTLETSRERFTEAQLVTNRQGISWEQRLRIGAPFRLSYSYRFEKNRTYETGPPDPFVGPFDLTVNVARISTAAVFDTRDDPTDATRGALFSYNLEHAPTTLGSQVRFLRQVAQAYRFQPWGRVVFASAARLGLAKAHGGQVVIPSERFYAGGARSVRGVAEDSLGPRDFDDTPAGGEALIVLNQEVRFPLAWRVRGVGFLDAGTVFERPSAIDLSDLVMAAGAGLRISTPVGLLRVDFARPWRGAFGEAGRWTFGIGQVF